ncbi:hypothetical protein MMC16_000050 [Acarospora aff. strigata]|nr:hypothetical protein [Acarospora aff. strigata]
MVITDNSLHLLRALLRECTYLPDPAARAHVHRHVLSRYRAYCPRPGQHSQPASKALAAGSPSTVSQTHLLRTARHGLAILQRANSGHLDALVRILSLTYGRTGKRRHQLLRPLLAPDIPADHNAVASLSASLPSVTSLELTTRLQALVKSQYRKKRLETLRPQIKHMAPKIPETNIWRRPMPVKRARNLKKRWIRMILENTLPPLPEEEWERLKLLANGNAQWRGTVRRRAGISKNAEEVANQLLHGASLVERLEEEISSSRKRARRNPHRISKRLMQRLWGRIFTQCPVMRWSASKKSWYVEWGFIERGNGVRQPAIDTSDEVIFKGVDERGKLLRQV